jgi:hypothetical protein
MSGDGSHNKEPAELPSPEQVEAYLRELEAWGFDTRLVRFGLQESSGDNRDEMLALLEFMHGVQRGMEQLMASIPPEEAQRQRDEKVRQQNDRTAQQLREIEQLEQLCQDIEQGHLRLLGAPAYDDTSGLMDTNTRGNGHSSGTES